MISFARIVSRLSECTLLLNPRPPRLVEINKPHREYYIRGVNDIRAAAVHPRRRHSAPLSLLLALTVSWTASVSAGLFSQDKSWRPIQSQREPARGMFLVAHEQLRDPNFARTVVLLVDYGDDGAFGLVINRMTDFRLSDAFPGLEGLSGPRDSIYIGGPVARDQIMFLIRPDAPPAQTVHVMDDVFFTGSLEAVMAVTDERGSDFRAYSGYAGWAAGQLDAEIARGDWIVMPGDPHGVFEADPEGLWGRLMQGLNLKSVQKRSNRSKAS